MSIFSKLSTVIKSNINDLISRAENPEKMLNQIILDMRDQLAKAKREVAAAIADERKLRASLDAEVKQMRQWEHRAMLAVKEDRDDLAKQALLRQQEHAERAGTLDGTWKAQAAETEKLKGSLRQLNDKIEEAKRKRNLLVAKQRRAQAQRRIHETMSGLSNTSAFEAFNRMADKIEEQERESLAHQEVAEALGPGNARGGLQGPGERYRGRWRRGSSPGPEAGDGIDRSACGGSAEANRVRRRRCGRWGFGSGRRRFRWRGRSRWAGQATRA